MAENVKLWDLAAEFGTSISVVHRIIQWVTLCFVEAYDHLIRPLTDHERRLQNGAFTDYPNAISIMDGTMHRMTRPAQEDKRYYDYKMKHGHSTNDQVFSNSRCSLNNVLLLYPIHHMPSYRMQATRFQST